MLKTFRVVRADGDDANYSARSEEDAKATAIHWGEERVIGRQLKGQDAIDAVTVVLVEEVAR